MDQVKINPFSGETGSPTLETLLSDLNKMLADGHTVDERRAKELRKQWENDKPSAHEEKPITEQIDALFLRLRKKVHAQVEQRNRQYRTLENGLTDLQGALTAGDLQTALGLEQRIVAGLNKIKGLSSQRRQQIITKLDTFRPKIRELSSWRKWGTDQVRETLIDEIKHLHEKSKDFNRIAKRIQGAREQWQEWDRHGEPASKTLYEKFDRICRTAYLPCQKHFDEQKKKRQNNARIKEEICRILEQKFDSEQWPSPDWKTLQKFLKDRRLEWQKTGPADHKQQQALQKRFDLVMEKFNDKLERERQRNFKKRLSLIDKITGLSSIEDTGKAMAELHAIKKQWVTTVPKKRNQENRIWKSFTQACDGIYQRKNQEKKQLEETLEENYRLKQSICHEMAQSINRSPMSRDDLNPRLRQWKTQWKEAGQVPKSKAKALEQRYRSLIKSISEHIQNATRARQNALINLLVQKAELCVELEAIAFSDSARNTETKEIKAISEGLRFLELLPEDHEKLIRQRFKIALKAIDKEEIRKQLRSDAPKNFQLLEQKILKLEILTETDSPPQYARSRMALQIERLSRAMGKGESRTSESPHTLILDILGIGAIKPAQRQLITRRFNQCLSNRQ